MALRVYKVPGVKVVLVELVESVIISGKEIPALGWSLCYGPPEATKNCEFPSLANLYLQPCPPSWNQGAVELAVTSEAILSNPIQRG